MPERPVIAGSAHEDSRNARSLWTCAALFLAALLLRLPGLNGGLWFDEVWMLVDFVRPPLWLGLTTYPSDNHHPLYTFLAGSCARAFGEAPWSLRLPALLFGAAGAAALYPFAARVCGPRAAWLASALLVVSPHHVAFSQNARGYTALLFFTLLATWAHVARRPVVQGACLALATFSHLTGAFVAAAQLLAWAIAGRDRSRAPLGGVLLGGALTLLLHAAMLPDVARFFFSRENPFSAESAWKSPLWTIAEAARSLGGGLAAMAAALALLGLGFARVWRKDREAALLLVLPPILFAAALVAMGRNLWPRSFFFAAGFGALVAAQGLLAVLDRIVPRAADAIAGIPVLASVALLPRVWSLPKQDFAGARDCAVAARASGEPGKPDEPVLTVGLASFPYEALYGGGFTAVDSREEMERVLAEAGSALVITTFPIYLSSRRPEIARFLEERGKEIARFRGSVGDGDVVVLRVE